MPKNAGFDVLSKAVPTLWGAKPSVSAGCFRAVLIWFPVSSLIWAGLVYGTMRWVF